MSKCLKIVSRDYCDNVCSFVTTPKARMLTPVGSRSQVNPYETGPM